MMQFLNKDLAPLTIESYLILLDTLIAQKKSPIYANTLQSILQRSHNDIDDKINICKTLPINESINAAKYLIYLCDQLKIRVCDILDYNPEYEPSEDEVLNEIRDNLQCYLDSYVESGLIKYLEEYNAYTDDVLLDLSSGCDGVRGYIDADDTECLIERYADDFAEGATETLINYYKKQHQYAASIEDDINEKCRILTTYISFVQRKAKFIEQSKLFNSNENKVVFADYLLHSDKESIFERIRDLLLNQKGRNVAIILKALEGLGYIAPITKYSRMYDVMRIEFGNIGTYEGILKHLQGRASTIIKEEEIDSIMNRLRG